MDYTQLIERLRLGASISRERKLNQGYEAVADEAAAAIEAMQTKVVELDHDTADLAMLADQYKAERDSALAKLAALEGQEPVDRAVVQQAIDAIVDLTNFVTGVDQVSPFNEAQAAITALRAALAQPDTAKTYMEGYSDGKAWAEGQPAKPVEPAAIISGYSIPVSQKRFADEIQVQRSRQIEGPDLWAVRLNGDCLNKKGAWEWEPMPSSRDDEFLSRCRFTSADEAIKAAMLAVAAKERA